MWKSNWVIHGGARFKLEATKTTNYFSFTENISWEQDLIEIVAINSEKTGRAHKNSWGRFKIRILSRNWARNALFAKSKFHNSDESSNRYDHWKNKFNPKQQPNLSKRS